MLFVWAQICCMSMERNPVAPAAGALGDDVERPLEGVLGVVGHGGALTGQVTEEEGGLALAQLDGPQARGAKRPALVLS